VILTVRPMTSAHLHAVLQLQILCYPACMQEDAEQIAARLRASPNQCWVAEDEAGVCAYLFGYRSKRGLVTPLNGAFKPDPQPDCLYLHDLAVAPRAAGRGVGPQLVAAALQQAQSAALPWSALVSVQDSGAFWERQGYRPAAPADEQQSAHLASYPAALYMERALV
jgi:GNAT superfamily N-acetyltransferase